MIIIVASLSKFTAHVTSSMKTAISCRGKLRSRKGATERDLGSATPFTFYFFFFDVNHLKKSLLNLLQCCFCCLSSSFQALRWHLSFLTEPHPSALEGEVLTTEPPGRSHLPDFSKGRALNWPRGQSCGGVICRVFGHPSG